MLKVNLRIYIAIAVLFIILISCSISFSPKKTPAPVFEYDQNEGEQAFLSPTAEMIPVEQAPLTPVGLNKGLSSLNSYAYSLQILTTGPTSLDKNDMRITNRYTSVGENLMTRTETISTSADEPEESRTVSTIYRVGNTTCTVEDSGESEAEVDDFSPAQRELTNIVTNLSDTVINPENPVFNGVEVVSGINCNHYTFTVSGLGKTSGAEVTQSQGEYWSAVDGNYLVKYDVVLETRNAPEGNPDAEVLHTEIHFLLSDVNAPITIELPVECSQG